jgi:hypothetical protein
VQHHLDYHKICDFFPKVVSTTMVTLRKPLTREFYQTKGKDKMTENNLVDPNTADEKELRQIPGIGPVMAERIVTARPFISLDDLQRVEGIGSNFIDQAGPWVTLSPAEPEDADAAEEESISPESESLVETGTPPTPEDTTPPETGEIPSDDDIPAESEEEAAPVAELPPEDETILLEKEPALVTRSQAIWMAFGSGLLAFVLAVALSLSVLISVNGGLKFATPAQMAEISRQVDGLSTQTNVLGQDLEGLRTRLDNLEGLNGRVDNVETAVEYLQTDVETIDAQIEGVSQHMADLDTQVETLKDQSARFQGFFDGLRDLLDSLFQSEGTK